MNSDLKLQKSRWALQLILSVVMTGQAGAETLSAVPNIQPQTLQSNRVLFNWLSNKEQGLDLFLGKRGQSDGPLDYIDFSLIKNEIPLRPITVADENAAKRTKQLYDIYFPPSDPSSYLGTFFESGHPHITTPDGGYQWNSMRASGVDSPQVFEQAITKLTALGFKSIRVAPNLTEVDPISPASWQPFMQKIETIWRHGATPTISVAFFPSLERWKTLGADGRVDLTRSYLLNPQWPAVMGQMAGVMTNELWKRASAFEKENPGHKVRFVINPINEPETLAGFNRQFWHDTSVPWNDAQAMRYYIPSVINIAKANVFIRAAVERSKPSERVLFMHNEAMTPEYYASHRGGGRFAVSKFMLGDAVLMNADFAKLATQPLSDLRSELDQEPNNEVKWSLKEYVFGSWNSTSQLQEAARQELVTQLQRLKDLHQRLITTTGKSMKTDNMLLLDYYYQTEFKLPLPAAQLRQHLAADQGAFLKEVVGESDDGQFMALLERTAKALETEQPKGEKILSEGQTRQSMDFERLLTVRDGAMLKGLVGLKPDLGLDFRPQFYARQMRAGIRIGFYRLAMTYINELGMHTVGVGESGTPFYVFAPLLHDQVMMEYVHVLRSGLYGTQYALGPAVNTRGWEKGPLALSFEKDHAINPSGILSVENDPQHPGQKTLKLMAWENNPGWVLGFIRPLLDGLREHLGN